MLGIVVILLVSWILLHYIESENLSVLGVFQIQKSIIEFCIGALFIFCITLIVIGMDTLVYAIDWQKHELINFHTILYSIWYNLKSAITEDLIFRGALLYLLVSKLGIRTGIILSATLFGVYHWFSYGMLLGQIRIIPLLYVFIITGYAGYVWAYAYVKTKSIMMPLGFHLGSNLVMSLFFKNAPHGELIFTEISKTGIENQWLNLIYLIAKGVSAPAVTYFFVNYWIKKHA